MTTLQPASDRPASFDALLLGHMAALRRRVFRMTRHDTDEVVADTIELALRRWANFDPAKGTFYNWLVWQARDAVRSYRKVTDKRWEAELQVDPPRGIGTDPVQDESAHLSSVLDHLSDIKNGDVLFRRAMGDTLMEIANDRGCSQERVRQIEKEARVELVRRAA